MKKIIIAISALCTVLLSSCFGKTEENQKNSTNSWVNVKVETNTGKTENNSWKTEDKTTSTGKQILERKQALVLILTQMKKTQQFQNEQKLKKNQIKK